MNKTILQKLSGELKIAPKRLIRKITAKFPERTRQLLKQGGY